MAVSRKKTARGLWIRAQRKAREYAMVVRALADTSHPVLAQIVPARFCNLSCGYCNEYDKVCEPVPLDEMLRRIDHLGRLGTAMIGTQWRRAADASRLGRDHSPDAANRRDCRDDHQRLSAECGADRAAEPRRPRPHADFHRQSGAGRCVDEELEGAGQEAGDAGRSTPSST